MRVEWAPRPMSQRLIGPNLTSNGSGPGVSRAIAGDMRNTAMGRYERRTYFERLCDLRDQYLQIEQRGSELTILGAIAYAEALTDDPAALDAVLMEEPSDTSAGTRAA